MCWAFNLVPSQLSDFLWTVTYRDIRTKVKLRFGEKYLDSITQFQAISLVLAQAFGGTNNSGASQPKNSSDLKAQLDRVFARNG